MKRLMAIELASLMAGATGMAKDKSPMAIARGTQIGVVNLLDPEVMHYHAAKESGDSFLKIQAVNWSADDMLNQALQLADRAYVLEMGKVVLEGTELASDARVREAYLGV